MSAAAVAHKRRQKCRLDRDDILYNLDTIGELVGVRGAVNLSIDHGEARMWGHQLTKDVRPLLAVFVAGGAQAIEATEVPCCIRFAKAAKNWSNIAEIIPPLKYLFPDQNELKLISTDELLSNDNTNNLLDNTEPLLMPYESWRTFALTSDASHVIVVGPKSSGKTSFTRFLVNHQLSKYGSGSVAYLDLDPGQPEHGISGLVSLSLPGKPLVGETFVRSCSDSSEDTYQTIKTIFLGTTSPKDDPEFYRKCIKDLVQAYRAIGQTPLLVVNTAGWIRGVGYELLCEIVSQVSSLTSDSQNGPTVVRMGAEGEDFPHFKTCSVEPVVPKGSYARTISSVDYRTLNQVCYFNSATSTEWLHFTEMTPYEVPFSLFVGFSIWGVSEGLSIKDIETILPATSVAILRLHGDSSDTAALQQIRSLRFLSDSLMYEPENTSYLCQAIVQSVNVDKETIRLIIPAACLPKDTNRLVLARGRTQLSLYETWNPKLIDSHKAPFLSRLSHQGIGSQHWRVRRNIKRVA